MPTELSNPIQRCPSDDCRRLHTIIGALPCLGLCSSGAPAENAEVNATGRFDPMQTTIGDLVRVKPRSDPAKATIGSLVDQKLGTYQEAPPPREISGVGDLVGQPLRMWIFPKVQTEAAASPPVVPRINGQFDPTQPTIGDLVGVKLGASQKECPDTACARMHARTNTPCLEPRACELVASVDQNGSEHFDPMKPTVGDLTDLKMVHVSVYGGIRAEPGDTDIAVHPRKIRMCSR